MNILITWCKEFIVFYLIQEFLEKYNKYHILWIDNFYSGIKENIDFTAKANCLESIYDNFKIRNKFNFLDFKVFDGDI